jgi:hypothetical protein
LHIAKVRDMQAAVLVKVPAIEFSGHWENG